VAIKGLAPHKIRPLRTLGLRGAIRGQDRAIELVGDKELQRQLREISGAGLRRVMRRALPYAITPVLDKARALVPRRTGMLHMALEKRSKVTAKSMYAMVWVNPMVRGVRIHPRKYAHLVEFGTSHSPPHSFMRAALASEKSTGVARLREKVNERLKIEWAKADAKGKLL